MGVIQKGSQIGAFHTELFVGLLGFSLLNTLPDLLVQFRNESRILFCKWPTVIRIGSFRRLEILYDL